MNTQIPGTYSKETREPMWEVRCDLCGNSGPKGVDPGESVEKARKKGFTTQSKGLGEPMTWLCPQCAAKAKKD